MVIEISILTVHIPDVAPVTKTKVKVKSVRKTAKPRAEIFSSSFKARFHVSTASCSELTEVTER